MTRKVATAPGAAFTAEQFGVGVRFSLHPMVDRFAELILTALDRADRRGLTLATDQVSTYLAGRESDLVYYLIDVIEDVGRSGVHTVAHILFSRGCPGEITCEPVDGDLSKPTEVPRPERTGLRAAADWSLYPLVNGTGAGDYMAEIERAVAAAREWDLSVRSLHYATRLEGDLADILSMVCGAWMEVGGSVAHVVSHVTVSLNSPSETDDE